MRGLIYALVYAGLLSMAYVTGFDDGKKVGLRQGIDATIAEVKRQVEQAQ
jgi:hypothetical protein